MHQSTSGPFWSDQALIDWLVEINAKDIKLYEWVKQRIDNSDRRVIT